MHKIKASNIKYSYGTDSKETWNVERQPIHGLNNLMYNDAGQNKKHKKNYSYNMVSNIAKGPQKVSREYITYIKILLLKVFCSLIYKGNIFKLYTIGFIFRDSVIRI